MDAPAATPLHRPMGLLAELTHRCPLGCPYCSNPLALEERHDELDTATWTRVFREAAELGCVHVGLTGGEPTTRRDLPEIVIEQIAHFFEHYKDLEKGKWAKLNRWADPAEAADLIRAGIDRAKSAA